MREHHLLEHIKTYEAGKPIELVVREFGIAPRDVVKLASNENPMGTSPKVVEAICQQATQAYRYPDDTMHVLKEALSSRFGIAPEAFIIGAGSDQVIELISRAYLEEGSCVLMTQVTFAMYEIYARQMGAQIVRTPSYAHRADEILAAYEAYRPKIIYLCTPNNPTGDAISRAEVLRIIDAVDRETLVVVDGAYMEYAAAKDADYAITPSDLIAYPHVIYLGTFSKAYGLGGLRVGYGIAQEALIQALYKLRPPFNVTTLSLHAAVAALEDQAFVEASIALHQSELARYEAFAAMHGLSYIESYTNFITYRLNDRYNSSEIADRLLRQGVIIRDLASYGMNAIRITIGTSKQNDRFFDLFGEVIA
jgi:histidinol-phosphate aminotransferase